ncbi:patatin-like phospholipase family protein [Emticicia sp. 21SJ11W-3]|uniref:patatin-like phospholipase family protein n=1 Tax=Emticicia sp. 21SJ11W-3 TaxID=2916755 RepID=UPI0020A182CA|nr:patatin-like phospholipase family protein [Emticicia sp. 21SJ11W-3]UTA67349.1 patatin-like phospholipase family protein [Emticicia sp. 21SJ11W-3]
MKALVLGGGSLKGAWQVGAIQAILETGFKPEMIYGISAGALNASFMVNEAGRQHVETGEINWDLVNKKLLKFWLENITRPSDIGILKSRFSLGIDTIMSRFNGLIDTNPLHDKLKKYLDANLLRKSPVYLKVGAVNINTGAMKYADPMEQHFLDYLRASSSLPFIMPAIQIGGDHREAYMDGGLREVVPVKKAIEDGATEIYCIATHPKHRPLEHFNYRNFLSLIERVKDITVNQFENSDIEWAENYAENYMTIGSFKLARKVNLNIIRPDEPIHLELTDFNSNDIREVIKQGYEHAYKKLFERVK